MDSVLALPVRLTLDHRVEALELCRGAGCIPTPGGAAGALHVATYMLGERTVYYVPASEIPGRRGMAALEDGRRCVWLAVELDAWEREFVLLHELAHWHLASKGWRAGNRRVLERTCNAIAWSIFVELEGYEMGDAPPEVVRDMQNTVGADGRRVLEQSRVRRRREA